MKREKRENPKSEDKRNVISVIGFLIAITLLSVAIIISLNQSENSSVAKLQINNLTKEGESTQTSQSLEKSINEVISKAEENNKIKESQSTSSIIQNDNKSNIASKPTAVNTTNTNSNIMEKKANDQVNNNTTNMNSINSKSNNENSQNNFILPVEGKITKAFSMNELVYSETLQEWTTHRGIDIAADKTTVVKAISDGTVKSIKQDPRYGLSIIIEHEGGFTSVYSCLLSSEFVKEGEKIKQGDSIGTIGNSGVFESADGSHLHLELMKDGEYVNPEIYIK